MRVLVKAKWPHIHTLSLRIINTNLGQNNIREEGYTFVYLSDWHQIKQIDCNNTSLFI